MWIFGYGSLVWKVDFPYTQKLIGYIKGYDRRFWQASIDHRGTPEKPGRVVTLVPSSNPEAKVWGVAYQILDPDAISKLNQREKRFSQITLDFYPVAIKLEVCDVIKTLTFIGAQNGPLFLGPAPIPQIVQQIRECEGPSGRNTEYIFKLVEFMRQELPHVEDEHLFQIEEELRRLPS